MTIASEGNRPEHFSPDTDAKRLSPKSVREKLMACACLLLGCLFSLGGKPGDLPGG